MTTDGLVWVEGLLLSQQHFQQWDGYLENRFRELHFAIAPYHYGVIECEFDEKAIVSGLVYIKKCKVIFQNGLYLSYEESKDKNQLSYQIENNDNKPCEIFLTVPNNNAVADIQNYPHEKNNPAYAADYRNIKDRHDHERVREVIFTKTNSKILPKDKITDDYISIKIAEIHRALDGECHYSKEYIFTCLHVCSSHLLMDVIREFSELLKTKIISLVETNKAHRKEFAEFNQLDNRAMLILQLCLISYTKLKSLEKNKLNHPMFFYEIISQYSSSLTALQDELNLEKIPVYQHHDLTSTILNLTSYIKQQMSQVFINQAHPLILQRESEGIFFIKNIDKKILENSELYLVVECQQTDNEWFKNFYRQIKITSYSDIQTIITTALPGVVLNYMQRIPKNLPIKAGWEYFYLQQNGTYWQKIVDEQSIAIFIPKLFSQAKLELVVLSK